MNDSTSSVSAASRSLTALAQNIHRQGPGGQAYELAPTVSARTRPDTPVPLGSRLKTRGEELLAKSARQVAKSGTQAFIKPLLDTPMLVTVLGSFVAVALVTMLRRHSARQRAA